MSNQYSLGLSPLTNRIYLGRARAGVWQGEKKDVTGLACALVAEHGLATGKPIEVYSNSKPVYRITVERLDDKE